MVRGLRRIHLLLIDPEVLYIRNILLNLLDRELRHLPALNDYLAILDLKILTLPNEVDRSVLGAVPSAQSSE